MSAAHNGDEVSTGSGSDRVSIQAESRKATRSGSALIWSAVTCHRFGRGGQRPLFRSESLNARNNQSADRSAHSKLGHYPRSLPLPVLTAPHT